MKLRIVILMTLTCLTGVLNASQENGQRPKIGLVLSGGGAKGFAHIPLLKMLDSLDIPVDYIAGTSMGGIAGALYSIGYSGKDLEKLAYRQDWEEIFTDKPRREILPYFQKKETGKYQLEFGMKGFKPVTPSGLIYGQKVALLFSGLTFPYEQVENFDQLPIPFRCVAIDLVSGTEADLAEGSLAKAMRATMAIPTIFSPVEWGDSLLIDGGFINNLPVDVAKAMGAEIIIASDVESPLLSKKELDNAIAVLNQTITLLGIDKKKRNLKMVDILVRPNMRNYTPADFDNDKIRGIILEGEKAVRSKLDELIRLKQSYNIGRVLADANRSFLTKGPKIFQVNITGQSTLPFDYIYEKLDFKPNETFHPDSLEKHLNNLRETDFFSEVGYEIIPASDSLVKITIRVEELNKPIINTIFIENNKNLPFMFIYRLLGFKPGDRLDTKLLNERIMRMYGLGYFESILYDIELIGNNLVNLILTIKELPLRRLRVGLRYDNHYKLTGVVSLQATNLLIPGLRIENEVQFAGIQKFNFRISYPSRALDTPVYPLAYFKYKNIPTNIFDEIGNRIASYKDRSSTFGFGVGFLLGKSYNLVIDYQQEYLNTKPRIALSDPVMFPEWNDNLHLLHAELDIDLLDNVLLPRKGFLVSGKYEGSFKELNSDESYQRIYSAADIYHTIWKKHTLRAYGFYGYSFGDIPMYKLMNQHYFEKFIGMKYDQLFASRLAICRFDYRFQHKKDIFFKLIFNAAFHIATDLPEQSNNYHYMRGIGLGVKLLSPIGPIELIYGYGDKRLVDPRAGQHVFYFEMGHEF
ncbi:BamA/TamA family outer membrane protein [candidate division KSB1 bacterium]|nr:BamA/TamA family outer membrane protein [candidate division KSB1 bacterium]